MQACPWPQLSAHVARKRDTLAPQSKVNNTSTTRRYQCPPQRLPPQSCPSAPSSERTKACTLRLSERRPRQSGSRCSEQKQDEPLAALGPPFPSEEPTITTRGGCSAARPPTGSSRSVFTFATFTQVLPGRPRAPHHGGHQHRRIHCRHHQRRRHRVGKHHHRYACPPHQNALQHARERRAHTGG